MNSIDKERSAYGYQLPKELVAREPAQRRDGCRLMVLDRASGAIRHAIFHELPEWLPQGALLVLNDTRVLPARARFRRPSGGAGELLFLGPCEGGLHLVLARPARRMRQGERLLSVKEAGRSFEVVERLGAGRFKVRVDPPLHEDPGEMSRFGEIPIPPYLGRPARPEDEEWYQCVYAALPGSIAAPTAGLHFTPELLEELRRRGVHIAKLTLHVGPGTFLPVRGENIEEHVLLGEPCAISVECARAVAAAKREGRPVVAVGTTVVRALEAAAPELLQGRPFQALTNLFIHPPYEMQVVDRLITNFHLPESTLLMLVAAFATRPLILEAYQEAVRAGYRFYSYGDAMLIH